MTTTADEYVKTTAYARNRLQGHVLDWAGRPDPFKHYPAKERMDLPDPEWGKQTELWLLSRLFGKDSRIPDIRALSRIFGPGLRHHLPAAARRGSDPPAGRRLGRGPVSGGGLSGGGQYPRPGSGGVSLLRQSPWIGPHPGPALGFYGKPVVHHGNFFQKLLEVQGQGFSIRAFGYGPCPGKPLPGFIGPRHPAPGPPGF